MCDECNAWRGALAGCATPRAKRKRATDRDGGWRFTVDYRDLNAVLENDQYRSPQPEDLYQQMRGARYFARMDARDGFWG